MEKNFLTEGFLKETGIGLGAADIGVADITVFGLAHYNKAVSVAVKMLDPVMDEIANGPTYGYYAHYKAVNELINHITLRLSHLIENIGYKAYPISASQSTGARSEYTSDFSHKSAATLAGLGYIGKNGLLIHKEFGPRVRLGTILTDAPLNCGEPIVRSDCANCTVCVKACPASALKGTIWEQGMPRDAIYDPRYCSEFMSEHFSKIGRGFVCGICAAVCPKGKSFK